MPDLNNPKDVQRFMSSRYAQLAETMVGFNDLTLFAQMALVAESMVTGEIWVMTDRWDTNNKAYDILHSHAWMAGDWGVEK